MSDSSDPSVTVICPNLRCRSTLRVPGSVRGKKVRCAKCGQNFLVPEKPKDKPKHSSVAADS